MAAFLWNRIRRRPKTCVLFLSLAAWDAAIPEVEVYYSKDGANELNYTWSTQHRTLRGGLRPGGLTGDTGSIFPDEDFSMYFFWWDNKGISGCVKITPKWPTTRIYLDAKGRVDLKVKGASDIERFAPCPGEEHDFLGGP